MARRLKLFFVFLFACFVLCGTTPVNASRTPGYDGSVEGRSFINITDENGDFRQATINYMLVRSATDHDNFSWSIDNSDGYITTTSGSGQTRSDGAENNPSVLNEDGEMWEFDERQYMMDVFMQARTVPGYYLQRSSQWDVTQSNFIWTPSFDGGNASTAGSIRLEMSTNGCNMTNYNGAFGVWWHRDTYNMWYTPITYQVSYYANGGSGSVPNSAHTYGQARTLNNSAALSNYYTVSLNPTGGNVSPTSVQSRRQFLGWSETSAGAVKYSNMQSVINLTTINNAIVPLYAKWGPAVLDPLPTPTRTGYTFLGWYNAANGGTQYFGGESVTSDMTLYAHWEPIKYWLQFDPNSTHGPGTVTGTMPTIQLTYDQPINLPINQYYKTTVSNKEYEGGPVVTKTSTFLGWSRTPTSLMPSYTDGQSVVNLTATNNDTITFYAVWDDSPKFIIVDFPNRYFSVAEAQAGKITADDLLSTVTAYDRETYPLAKGSNPGITIPTYDANLFTSVTGDATIPVQYYLRDSWGHEAWLNIIVRITSIEPNFEESVEYIRGISGKYWKNEDGSFVDKDAGGLDENSVWRNDPAYTNQLDKTLDEDKTNTKTYEFTPEELESIRNNAATNGIGANNLDEQLKNGTYDK